MKTAHIFSVKSRSCEGFQEVAVIVESAQGTGVGDGAAIGE